MGRPMTSLRPAVVISFLVEEGADDAGGVDAANFGNFRSRNGLLVSDDRERFKSGHGETKRGTKTFDEAANDVVVLGLGVHLVATGNGADFDAAFIGGTSRRRIRRESFARRFYLRRERSSNCSMVAGSSAA